MASNISRREAYQFYRSIGYSAAEARNMRNRGVDTLISDYRGAMNDYNEKRKENYEKDFDAPYEKPDRPYRPEIPPSETYQESRIETFENLNIPTWAQDAIENETADNAFALDLYTERLGALQDHLTAKGHDWDALMDQMDDYDDLGDFMDILGELYGEEN